VYRSLHRMASASSISLAEKADDAGPTAMATPEVNGEPERQYLTGIKLAVMLGSLTLVTFLNLLDIAIVGTVSRLHPNWRGENVTDIPRPYLVSQPSSTLSKM
jgi:hypothetical protein